MSPVGHSLVGLAFAALAYPKNGGMKWRIGLPVAFIALASLPDWPIPNWGHDRYDISHSIFVNVALISIVVALYNLTPRLRSKIPKQCLWLGFAAWLSHLLLDSFYNHGRGVAIYWPFSKERLNLAVPCFDTLDLSQSMFSTHNMSVYMTELVAYIPLLIVAIGFRKMNHRKPNATSHINAE